MQIIHKNLKHGEVKIKVENFDDIWDLSQIIEEGDRISSKTERKVRVGEMEKTEKKTLTLGILVKQVEFHKYADMLRISGTIVEGPEDISRGSHHTLDVEVNSIIKITKEKWPEYQIKKIEEASKNKSIGILVCVFDRGEASFALLKKYGYEYLSDVYGEVQKKGEEKKVDEEVFYGQLLKNLLDYDEKYALEQIVIASPAFWKETFFEFVKKKNKDLAKKVILATCSYTGEAGINEVLKRDEVKTALKNSRTIYEFNLVEDLFKEISKKGNCAYGLTNAKSCAEMGSVKELLITNSFIKKSRVEDTFKDVENLIQLVEKYRGEVHIISSEHEAGKKLDTISGIGALLRYKTEWQ